MQRHAEERKGKGMGPEGGEGEEGKHAKEGLRLKKKNVADTRQEESLPPPFVFRGACTLGAGVLTTR
jgi:hypothetical protein